MADLQDFIAEQGGITLHRRRVLKAFSHVPESPLMDVLFNITRPPLRIMNAATGTAPAPAPPVTQTIRRKGMVDYRRELHGLSDQPDTDSK